jgi:hypothetical protein
MFTGKPRIAPAVLGLVVAVLGLVFVNSGHQVTLKWSAIGAAFAACGVAWLVTGAAMVIGGLGTVISLGRQRLALWTGAVGSILSGVILIAGVLTYVVPCSGPS